LVEEKTIIAATGCDEILPEILNTLNREGILWLTPVCQVAWCSGRAQKFWKTGVIKPKHMKKSKTECTKHRGISHFSLPGKMCAKWHEKRCDDIFQQTLAITQCILRPCCSTIDQTSLSRKFSRNFWRMQNAPIQLFLTSRRHTTGSLVKSCEVC